MGHCCRALEKSPDKKCLADNMIEEENYTTEYSTDIEVKIHVRVSWENKIFDLTLLTFIMAVLFWGDFVLPANRYY